MWETEYKLESPSPLVDSVCQCLHQIWAVPRLCDCVPQVYHVGVHVSDVVATDAGVYIPTPRAVRVILDVSFEDLVAGPDNHRTVQFLLPESDMAYGEAMLQWVGDAFAAALTQLRVTGFFERDVEDGWKQVGPDRTAGFVRSISADAGRRSPVDQVRQM